MTMLPMLGKTHGSRSAVTCHFKCDSACDAPVPNQSTEPTFREIASAQLSRRNVLLGGTALAVTAALPAATLEHAAAAPAAFGGGADTALRFTPINPVPASEDGQSKDAMTVPRGFQSHIILRWGDPLFHTSPRFNPLAPNAEAQEEQFGYNGDYLDILVNRRSTRRAVLVCNHEYTNRNIMFPPTQNAAQEAEVLRTLMAAHGMSVVELERAGRGKAWHYIRGGRRNRRITANTLFQLTGPAAGSDLVKTAADPTGRRVLGTFGNCAGGTTPWGTILSGEENFNGYFVATDDTPGNKRYGLTSKPSSYGWEKIDPRFNATTKDFANEPHRFGYIVEVDPSDPTSVPRKHTAMGRFKHEGANLRVDEDGTVSAYMGDDERFDYLYKFVAKRKFRKGSSAAARRHNKTLLTEGDLYVAKFSGVQKPTNDNLGRGVWLPITQDGKSVVPGMTTDEVLVFTRLAADKLGATPMDRPEDVQPNPRTGKIYVPCTNNTDRGKPGKPGPDAANPRPENKNGHIIEITEHQNKAGATSFAWNLFLVCGKPDEAGTYFGGWDGPVAPIACPDNLAFDSKGNLWISTDGANGTIQQADGLFRVPLEGKERGHLVQFLAVPNEAECTGPVIHDRDGSVFVMAQHPGEEGEWNDQHSLWPDKLKQGTAGPNGSFGVPRPSCVQVLRR
ncbi:MAG TPA: PhoX family phosphatase [Propionibacteriaceae bacterium]|nr:PhoX family phosphatase [Propionibacteriaceae bacterium]